MRNRSAPLRSHADRELRDEVLLERADAEHEEAAEPDRQQDDPRLVARAAEADHGVAQRKPAGRTPAGGPAARWRRRRCRAPARRRQSRRRRRARRATIPPATTRPRPARPPTPTPTPACSQSTAATARAGVRRRPAMAGAAASAPRSSSSGLTRPHVEQRHEREQQRHEQADASRPAAPPTRSGRTACRRATSASARGDHAAAPIPASATPSRLPASAEQRDLQRRRRASTCARRRAEALEDRDAPDLLAHEHARHAPDADAAEHDDDEADEAQDSSPRARRSSPIWSSVRPVGAGATKRSAERAADVRVSGSRLARAPSAGSGSWRGCRRRAGPSAADRRGRRARATRS